MTLPALSPGHVLVAGELAVVTLQRAVIFMWARWSAPCRARLRDVQDVPPPTAAPWFHILDIDSASPAWMIDTLDLSHGHGETYWIRDGLVVHRILRPPNPPAYREQLVRHTAALFAA